MTYLLSILMGIIQGVAEFLPISSSGHLALFQTFFGMENVEEKYMFFTVLLHFGTFISVCVVYWRDIVEMIREFFLGIAALAGKKDTGTPPPPARRMVMLIIIGTLPLFVMVFLQDAVNKLFSNSIMVSCALLVTGFMPVSYTHLDVYKRQELAIALPRDWKLDRDSMEDERWYWPVRLLKVLARLPGNNDTWLGWGHTMDHEEPFAENTKLCAAMLIGAQGVGEDGAVLSLIHI